MFGQGQLHKDAVYLGVSVHLLHQRQQIFLSGIYGQSVVVRMKADLFTSPFLGCDIGPGRRVIPDQNHAEPWHHTLGLELSDLLFQFRTHICGDLLAINDLCCHAMTPYSNA